MACSIITHHIIMIMLRSPKCIHYIWPGNKAFLLPLINRCVEEVATTSILDYIMHACVYT